MPYPMHRRRSSRWRRRRNRARARRTQVVRTPQPTPDKSHQDNLVTQALIQETARQCSERVFNRMQQIVETKVNESSTDRSSMKESIKYATRMLKTTVDQVRILENEVQSSSQNQAQRTRALIRENVDLLNSRMDQKMEKTQTSLDSLSRRYEETDGKFKHFQHQLSDVKEYVANGNRSDIQLHVVARCAVDVFSIDPIEVSEPVEPLRALRIYPGEVCTLLLKPETIGDTTQKRVAPKNKRFVRCVRLASSSRTSPSKTLLPVPVIVYVEYIASNFENVRLTTPSRTIQSSPGKDTGSKKLTL